MADGSYNVRSMTDDLRYILTLTNVFTADEEGYWYLDDEGKRYLHKLDKNDEPHEIVLIQDPMPRGNYLTFNPFSEGMGKPSPANTLFYRTLRIALNTSLEQVVIYSAGQVLETKKAAEAKEDYAVSQAVIRVSSIPVGKRQSIYDVIDEDTIKELKLLFERLGSGLIQTPYLTASMTCKVVCDALTDSEFDGKFGKDIRKKTMQVFRALVMGVLGITKPEELSQFSEKYDASLKSAPRLHATMMVYFKLYQRFNDLISDATGTEAYTVDLGMMLEAIERFPFAYAIGKHMMQPSVSSVKAVETKTSDTSGQRFATPTSAASGGQTRRFGAPPAGTFGGMATQPQQSRFKPDLVEAKPYDPFAPLTAGGGMPMGFTAPQPQPVAFASSFAPMNNNGFGGNYGGGGFAQTGLVAPPAGFGGNTGGGFGGNFSSGFMGGTPNYNAPSNFGMPGANRFFTGR